MSRAGLRGWPAEQPLRALTYKWCQGVARMIAIKNSLSHMRYNVSENYPQFGHVPYKFRPAQSRTEYFIESWFEGATFYQPAWSHKLLACPWRQTISLPARYVIYLSVATIYLVPHMICHLTKSSSQIQGCVPVMHRPCPVPLNHTSSNVLLPCSERVVLLAFSQQNTVLPENPEWLLNLWEEAQYTRFPQKVHRLPTHSRIRKGMCRGSVPKALCCVLGKSLPKLFMAARSQHCRNRTFTQESNAISLCNSN